MSVSLCLVVRNELVCCQTVVPRIDFDLFDQVFAIDGNSIDGTFEYLDSFQHLSVYRQSKPGLGAAMMEARKLCTSSHIIFFHPDGNEDEGDLPKMKDLLLAGNEFVVASRMIDGAFNEDDVKFFRFRKWGNLFFVSLANLLFGNELNKTTDVTNGFRGISVACWDHLDLKSEGLTMDYEMVIRALKKNVKIVEFPTVEGLRVDGKTTFASIPTGIEELKLVLREIWRK